MKRIPSALVLFVFAALFLSPQAAAADKLRLLIIDGQNNHNWRVMTPPMKAKLESTGRFVVEVATTPGRKGSKEAWDKFRPDFSSFDVVLSNYNGQSWPAPVNKGLEDFISAGGGLVIIHAANNAFGGWKEYNKMIALGWRNNKYGPRLTVDDSGKPIITAAGEGPGAGHGRQHAFEIVVRDSEHPVMKGMPKRWMHARDELYHGQRGPAKLHLLASLHARWDSPRLPCHFVRLPCDDL